MPRWRRATNRSNIHPGVRVGYPYSAVPRVSRPVGSNYGANQLDATRCYLVRASSAARSRQQSAEAAPLESGRPGPGFGARRGSDRLSACHAQRHGRAGSSACSVDRSETWAPSQKSAPSTNARQPRSLIFSTSELLLWSCGRRAEVFISRPRGLTDAAGARFQIVNAPQGLPDRPGTHLGQHAGRRARRFRRR
jgi:hypothetical protein